MPPALPQHIWKCRLFIMLTFKILLLFFCGCNLRSAIWFHSQLTELAINSLLLFGSKGKNLKKNETINILQVSTKSVKWGLTHHIKAGALKRSGAVQVTCDT